MPQSVPATIKLEHKYNKPVLPGKTQKNYDISDLSSRYKDKKFIEERIQYYRLWYRFLQLALELEEKKVKMIIDRDKEYFKKPKKDKWGNLREWKYKEVTYPVKVTRKGKYSKWSLDIIPNTSFDKWWSSHKHLFYVKSAELIYDAKDIVDDEHFMYIKIDRRSLVNDRLKEIRNLMNEYEDKMFNVFSKENKEFNRLISDKQRNSLQVLGKEKNLNTNVLQNRYNALLLKISTDMSDKDILQSKYMRTTKSTMEKGSGYKFDSSGRAMRDLLEPARNTLLSVCNGFFPQDIIGDFNAKLRRAVKEGSFKIVMHKELGIKRAIINRKHKSWKGQSFYEGK